MHYGLCENGEWKRKGKIQVSIFHFLYIEQYVFHDRFEQKPISHKCNWNGYHSYGIGDMPRMN